MNPIRDARTTCRPGPGVPPVPRPTRSSSTPSSRSSTDRWPPGSRGCRCGSAMITGHRVRVRRGRDDAGSGCLVSWLVRRLYWTGLSGVHVVFFQNPDDEAPVPVARHRGPAAASDPARGWVRGGSHEVQPGRRSPRARRRSCSSARVIRDKGVAEYVEAAHHRSAGSTRRPVSSCSGRSTAIPPAISKEELDGWVAGGAIEYLGRTPDVRPNLAAAHVCVLPSYGEGMPRSVLEAMAMGRPVIVDGRAGLPRNGRSPVTTATSSRSAVPRLAGRGDDPADRGPARTAGGDGRGGPRGRPRNGSTSGW